jgi:hypothetical protein
MCCDCRGQSVHRVTALRHDEIRRATPAELEQGRLAREQQALNRDERRAAVIRRRRVGDGGDGSGRAGGGAAVSTRIPLYPCTPPLYPCTPLPVYPHVARIFVASCRICNPICCRRCYAAGIRVGDGEPSFSPIIAGERGRSHEEKIPQVSACIRRYPHVSACIHKISAGIRMYPCGFCCMHLTRVL